jgi:hypothetical protein
VVFVVSNRSTSPWAEVNASFCFKALSGSPDRVLDLLSNTALKIQKPTDEDILQWKECWGRLMPSGEERTPQAHSFHSLIIQLLSRVALENGYPAPLDFCCAFSPINQAALIMASCLTVLLPMPPDGADALPSDKIPVVRAWLLRSLAQHDRPYADMFLIDDDNIQSKPIYLTGYVPSKQSKSDQENELAWALDNATALRMKSVTDRQGVLLYSISDIQKFSDRMEKWPEAEAALLRTSGLAKLWPRRQHFCQFNVRKESLCVSNLTCAALNLLAWPKISTRFDVISLADQRKYLHSYAGVKTIRTCFTTKPGPNLNKFIASFLDVVGPEPFAETSGKNIAHILLEAAPLIGSINLLISKFGPEIMTTPADYNLMPLKVARQYLEHRYAKEPDKVGPKMAALERAVLRASLKGVRRPKVPSHVPSSRRM